MVEREPNPSYQTSTKRRRHKKYVNPYLKSHYKNVGTLVFSFSLFTCSSISQSLSAAEDSERVATFDFIFSSGNNFHSHLFDSIYVSLLLYSIILFGSFLFNLQVFLFISALEYLFMNESICICNLCFVLAI
jgi:hypothetical protein